MVNLPFTPRVKRLLNYARKAAESQNMKYVGIEHIVAALGFVYTVGDDKILEDNKDLESIKIVEPKNSSSG